ncbi:uncharacterized protein LOC110906098 [Helianthus annuus]|uniref:uncharacterized protein LOC110906098 n=1 Tax=Helianthus annuus TaxID=4232 RepID=UPI0016530CC7|nr:uncharacterized protein LOC110906098 [Helianthus annuus]
MKIQILCHNCKNVLLDGDGCKPFGSSTPPSIPAKDKGVLPIPTPVKRVEAIVSLLMQIRIQKKQLTVTHMKVSWLVMGLGMTLSNKIGRRARVYPFSLFLFHVFFPWKTSFFTSFWPASFAKKTTYGPWFNKL